MLSDNKGAQSARRSRVVRLLSAGLIALGCATLPSTPAASAEAPIEAGSALASTHVLTAKVTYGGFTLPIYVGSSSASYNDADARATSQGISAGVVSGTSTASTCESGGTGGEAAPTPLSQPPFAPLEVSSASGPGHKDSGSVPIGSGEVNAQRSPLASNATTNAIALNIPGVIKVSGSSTAAVSYEAGKRRNARAGVSADVTIGNGLVKLSALSWDIEEHGARARASSSSFSVASVSVAGKRFPVGTTDQLQTAINAVNSAVKFLGIAIDLPKMTRGDDTILSALNIRVFGSKSLAVVIRPLLELKAPIQDALSQLLAAGGCSLASLAGLVGTTELIADVVLAALSGAGTIEIGVGGTQVSTQPPPDYVDPFGDPNQDNEPPSGDPPTEAAPITSPPLGAVGAPAPAPAAPVLTEPAPSTPTAYRITCISTNSADHRGCSDGAGARLTALLLLAGLALFAADIYQGRRRQLIVRRSVR